MDENLNLKDIKKQIDNLSLDESGPLEVDPKIVSNDLLERGKKNGKLSIQEVAVALDVDGQPVNNGITEIGRRMQRAARCRKEFLNRKSCHITFGATER